MTFMDSNSCLLCCLLLPAGATATVVAAVAVPGLLLVLVHGEVRGEGNVDNMMIKIAS